MYSYNTGVARKVILEKENNRIGKSLFKRWRNGYCDEVSGGIKVHLRKITNLKKHNARNERRRINQQLKQK